MLINIQSEKYTFIYADIQVINTILKVNKTIDKHQSVNTIHYISTLYRPHIAPTIRRRWRENKGFVVVVLVVVKETQSGTWKSRRGSTNQ